MGLELRPEHFVMNLLPFSSTPCVIVNSIRDVAYEKFFRKISRIHLAEYLFRHVAMQLRNSIYVLAEVSG